MKRFIQVILQTEGCISGNERGDFEDRCSCAVACGYVPCGATLQISPAIEGAGTGSITGGTTDGDGSIEGKFSLDINANTHKYCLTQAFYDPEGMATLICANCTKCGSCTISPGSDVYCSKFEDACYREEE